MSLRWVFLIPPMAQDGRSLKSKKSPTDLGKVDKTTTFQVQSRSKTRPRRVDRLSRASQPRLTLNSTEMEYPEMCLAGNDTSESSWGNSKTH